MYDLLKNSGKNMMTTQRTLLHFVLILLAFVSSCKEDGPSLIEQAKAQLTAGPWGKPTVTVEGVDQSNAYEDFTITFGDQTYQSVNGDPMWQSTGTWAFADNEGKVMTLDGDIEVKINRLDGDALELELVWDETTFEPGRTQSFRGRNIFFLRPNR